MKILILLLGLICLVAPQAASAGEVTPFTFDLLSFPPKFVPAREFKSSPSAELRDGRIRRTEQPIPLQAPSGDYGLNKGIGNILYNPHYELKLK